MSRSHENIAARSDAGNFFKHGMQELGHLVLDEYDARLGMLVVMASGSNGVFVGEPGGGKTTLAENAHRIVDGIEDGHRAIIPPEADLKPRQLVGGSSAVKRKVDGVTEEIITETVPIMSADTKVIWADEINRGAPHAINALLGALASRKFSNTAGEVHMNELEYAVSTMNPGGLNEGVFKINPANASRHAVGALMGLGEGEDGHQKDADQVIDGLLGGWRSKPEKMEQIVDLETLQAIRNYIKSDSIVLPASLRAETLAKIKRTKEVLDERGVHEAYPRLTIHIHENAKAIAALMGEEAVEPGNIDQAIKFVVAARLGMRKQDPEQEIPNAIDSIGKLAA